MTPLEHQIRSAQRRLWLNRWFGCAVWSIAVAGLVYAVVVLLQRLFDLPIPLGYVGLGLAGATLLLATIWTVAMREGALTAAAALDHAAGLKERLSTGHTCAGSDDPFAKAVVVDAQRIASSITARQHIRLQVPRALAAGLGSLVLAALMFLITPGLLLSDETVEAQQQEESVRQAQVAVKRQMKEIQDTIEATPALDDLKDEAAKLDMKMGGQLNRPDDVRYEAAKRIDNLADAVKRKRNDSKYDALQDMRKRLRALKAPSSEEGPTQKLTKALQQGDFKQAKEEVKALQEQLATLKKEQDQEAIDKLSKQLDALAKQLEKLDHEEKLKEQLQQAGIKKEDLDRVLESLKKKDLEQIKKSLQQKGMNPKAAEQLAKQIKQNQGAGSMAKKLAQAMKQASQAAAGGQQGQAAAGLSSAGQQLDQLEQLEQEMNQLESTMSQLQQARSNMGSGDCNKGSRGGMGKKGSGEGGLAPEEETDVAFKTERGKVKTTKGAIIGQFLVDGEQVKGEVTTEFVDLMSAAEREASDRISRDRIPRQYQKAVKSYFSNVQKSLEEMKRGKSPGEKSEDPADDSSSKTPTD